MAELWQRKLINRMKREAGDYLAELEKADDVDLWEEMVGKMADVLVVWRRAQSKLPAELATNVRITDAQLSILAFEAALGHAMLEDEEEASYTVRGDE